MQNALVTLVAILLVIGFHEYGHFRTLKKFGIVSPEFSVGIGSKIFSFSHDGTLFVMRMFPVGGFVTFPEDWKNRITKWQMIRVLFAGPWANVISAIPFGIIMVLQSETFAIYPWWIMVLLVIFGTPIFFLVSIPVSLIAVLMMFIHPGESIQHSGGMIGAMTEGRAEGESLFFHFVSTVYFFSIGVASFNLLPLSFLDGAKIYAILLSKYDQFLKYWSVGSTIVLLLVVVLINGGDLLQAFGLM